MISELMPQGYDNMFFALFGITNRAVSWAPLLPTLDHCQWLTIRLQSSIIGPNVIQAIINNTQNNWMGFPFLFAICAAAMIAIGFVDVEKGREDSRKFVLARTIAPPSNEPDVDVGKDGVRTTIGEGNSSGVGGESSGRSHQD